MEELKAVLTADVVNSSALSKGDYEDLVTKLKMQLKQAEVKAEFYRGDSFHLLSEAEDAIELALKLRLIAITHGAQDRKIDLRLAIGLAEVDMPVKSLSLAQDRAFIISGRELDRISAGHERMSVLCTDDLANEALKTISWFIDFLMSELSNKQAEVLLETMRGLNQEEIAVSLKKSQPTVNKLLLKSNYAQIIRLISSYKRIIKKLKQSC